MYIFVLHSFFAKEQHTTLCECGTYLRSKLNDNVSLGIKKINQKHCPNKKKKFNFFCLEFRVCGVL